MKKKLLKTIPLLLMALAPLAMSAVNTIIHTASYDLSKITIGTDTLGGVTYNTVHYDGLYNDGAPGMPSLPVDYIRFSVPWNATNFTVSAALQNNLIRSLSNLLLYPCQPYRFMDDTTHHDIVLPDNATYNSATYYPSSNAWVVDEGFLAGENHIVTVAVMPISYNRRVAGGITTNRLKQSQAVRLTLSYELRDSLAMYPIVRQDTELRREGYRLAQSMVVNPDNVTCNAPIDVTLDSLSIIPNSGDGLNGGSGNIGDIPPINNDTTGVYGGEMNMASKCGYLIVTTSDLCYSLRRLAALKRQKGYNVKIMTMDSILTHPYAGQGDMVNNVLTFPDDAGKLRQYLRILYRLSGVKYLLLAGSDVPFRKSNWPPKAPCDMYFSDFHTDYRYQNYDNKPELYVGRLLARTEEQIDNYTDKLFRYELNPGHGNPSYLKRALYTEGINMIGHSLPIRTVLNPLFTDTIIFREQANLRIPKGSDIINEINNTQYGFMSFHNHGEPSSIVVYGVDNNSTQMEYDHCSNLIWAIDTVHISNCWYAEVCDTEGNALNNLNNKWYPNIVYSEACKTIPYDTINHFENIPVNFGESFTTGKDYGGPAFLGNTRDGIISASFQLEQIFAQQIVNGRYKIGETEAWSKALYSINQVNTTHNLLGEPEFEMWTDIPQNFVNINITRSDNSITVCGIGTDSTIVSLCGNQATELLMKMIISSSSVTFNNVSPNSSIMLYKHNYIPYIAPLVLQKVDLNRSQYVIASDVTAGRSVDSGRTNGDVTVKNGIEYEIEASGTVTLEGGFSVEKGATFAVYPSSF